MDLVLSKVVWQLFILVAVLSCGFGEVGAQYKAISQTRADRILVERDNTSGSSLTLRTERIDPLDDLKKYKGGYNITNKHYWSSAVFTGKFGYIVAALWIVSGLIYGMIVLVSNLCFNKRRALYRKNKSRVTNKHSLWPIVLGLTFTVLAIVASGVALGGSSRFHSEAKAIKNTIVGAANEASSTIRNVTTAVQSIQRNTEVYVNLAGSSSLNTKTQKLSDDADNIRRKAEKNMHRLNKGLRIMNVSTIITVSLNLIAILALLASRTLKFRRICSMLISLCWVLAFLFWLYFGFYYFLDKVAGDTCAALEEYRQDPRNSTLSSILPCNDRTSAKKALREVAGEIHGIVDQVNANISRLQSPSLPVVEYVCNPFLGPPDYRYQPENNCSANTIRIRDIPQVLKMYTCSAGTCREGEFIPAHDYDIALEAINSIEMILDAYPGMQRLVDCQLVRDAFSKILSEDCEPLKKYAHTSWAAFATLSTIMAVLLVTWMVEARRDSRYCSSNGSVKPHSVSVDDSEAETVEIGSRQPGFKP